MDCDNLTVTMDINTIFKITAIGIVIAVVNIILSKAGRDEYTMLTTLSGIIIVIAMIIDEVKTLFTSLENLFNL